MKKWLAALLLTLGMSSAQAGYNGEFWITPYEWYLGSGCPDYVVDVAQEIMSRDAPMAWRYMGELDVPSTIEKNDKSVIFCTQDFPGLAAHVPEEGWGSDKAEAVAAYTMWWWTYTGDFEFIREADIWLKLEYLDEETVYRYLWHELYHAWGIQHDPDSRSLMYWAPLAFEPFIYDKAELNNLYKTCDDQADSNANMYVAGIDMTDYIQTQEPLFRQLYKDFIGRRVSYTLMAGGVWPDDVERVGLSRCR